MDERIVIRYLSGERAHQTDTFPVKATDGLVIGREKSCQVKFHPAHDDLVSRRHAKITVESRQPAEFSLQDLGSRNGTFVNGRRISKPVRLVPGDVVQFGSGGPEFRFDIESDSGPSAVAEPAPPTRHGTKLPLLGGILLLIGLAVAYTVLSATSR